MEAHSLIELRNFRSGKLIKKKKILPDPHPVCRDVVSSKSPALPPSAPWTGLNSISHVLHGVCPWNVWCDLGVLTRGRMPSGKRSAHSRPFPIVPPAHLSRDDMPTFHAWKQRWQTTEEMKMTWFLRAATSCLPCWLHTAGASWIRHEPGRRCLFTQTWFIKSEPGSFPRISAPERPALGRCNCPCWSLWEASGPSTCAEDSETHFPPAGLPPYTC